MHAYNQKEKKNRRQSGDLKMHVGSSAYETGLGP